MKKIFSKTVSKLGKISCAVSTQFITETVAERIGLLPMIMKGKEYKGYCYVAPAGFRNKKDFEFWINLCLDFNHSAKSSKKRKGKNINR